MQTERKRRAQRWCDPVYLPPSSQVRGVELSDSMSISTFSIRDGFTGGRLFHTLPPIAVRNLLWSCPLGFSLAPKIGACCSKIFPRARAKRCSWRLGHLPYQTVGCRLGIGGGPRCEGGVSASPDDHELCATRPLRLGNLCVSDLKPATDYDLDCYETTNTSQL